MNGSYLPGPHPDSGTHMMNQIFKSEGSILNLPGIQRIIPNSYGALLHLGATQQVELQGENGHASPAI